MTLDQPELSPEEAAYNMWRWQWRRRIAIAGGQFEPSMSLVGGRVLNVFTGELVVADVAIDAGVIVAIGRFPNAREVIDCTGLILAPSFIDPHLHLESTLLWPPELAKVVVPHGTGTIITDPHEVANVTGLRGVRALRDATLNLPLDIRFTVPSCVPASPFESPGASFDQVDIDEMLTWPETVALGEMMNFPGVLAADPAIAARLNSAGRLPRDGHAPELRGRALQAYISAGIDSDHESVTLEEAREKLDLGMMVMIRQGSSEKNLAALLPLVSDRTWHRITFCSDDRDCHDLTHAGHMDDILRTAVELGLDPVRAIQMATWNPAQQWRLNRVGAIAPGYRANIVALSNLQTMKVEHTFHNGGLVASGGEMVASVVSSEPPKEMLDTVHVAPVRHSHFATPDPNPLGIDLVPGQIVTRVFEVPAELSLPSVPDDILKLVCVERHHASGQTGVAAVRGFGLRQGAMASSIAHDAHNIVAVGTNDTDILAAIAIIAESGGGLAVVSDLEVLAHLPLPINGLMSDQAAEVVAMDYEKVEQAAKALGSPLASPFGQLAFLALSVIPEARITDRGFLDLRAT